MPEIVNEGLSADAVNVILSKLQAMDSEVARLKNVGTTAVPEPKVAVPEAAPTFEEIQAAKNVVKNDLDHTKRVAAAMNQMDKYRVSYGKRGALSQIYDHYAAMPDPIQAVKAFEKEALKFEIARTEKETGKPLASVHKESLRLLKAFRESISHENHARVRANAADVVLTNSQIDRMGEFEKRKLRLENPTLARKHGFLPKRKGAM